MLGGLPKVFNEFFNIDAGWPTDISDNIFGSLVIDVLIPFGEVRIWKLIKKYLLNRMLGIFQTTYHVRVNQTFRYDRAFSHDLSSSSPSVCSIS